MASLHELRRADKTLACLLQGMEGMRVRLETVDGARVTGTIEAADATMNVLVRDALVELPGGSRNCETYYVRGRRVRFVEIPDEVNVISTIRRRLAQTDAVRQAGVRRKRKGPSLPREGKRPSVARANVLATGDTDTGAQGNPPNVPAESGE